MSTYAAILVLPRSFNFFYSFFLPSFNFVPSSCLLLFFILIFVKIPSYLSSDLFKSSFLPGPPVPSSPVVSGSFREAALTSMLSWVPS